MSEPQPSSDAEVGQTLLTQHGAAALDPTGVPSAPETMTAPPRRIAGYVVERELGRGGMGVVYQARDVKLGRVVALKMILSGEHAGSEDLTRFLAEAQAVAGLQHPNIVQVYEIAQHEGLPYFTLEYVAGGALSARLRGEPQTPRDAAHLVELLARAVDHAHKAGIVHRDLKPANVLLMEEAATPLNRCTPKVTDFGLAKRTEGGSGMTQSGAIMGTPSYMAPEQAAGRTREVGPRSDLYSLGAILYEMLTGRPPFRCATAAETLMQAITDEPVTVRQLQARTPRDLETICHKCLHKDPARRYASAAELADDLQRFQKGEPIQARPVGRLERGWRWCRRNPVVAALLVLVGLASVFSAWQWQSAAAALKQVETEQKARALDQVNALREAAPAAVPALLKELSVNRATTLPRLRELWQEGGERGKRMRVGLALLPVEPEAVREDLLAWMQMTPDPAEAVLVRDVLASGGAELSEPLWKTAGNETAEAADRFRALVALAAFDPGSPRWTALAPVAVTQMLKANPLHLGVWVQALRPVADPLLTPLTVVYREEKSAERREFAATVLSDFASQKPDVLAELLLDADPKQYAVLFPVLDRYRQQAVERMRRELTLQADVWIDPPLDPAWSAVPAELRREIESAAGLVDERWAMCQALPLERVPVLTEGLRGAGYRPVRVRPWVQVGPASRAGPVSSALVWTRDGRDWKLETNLTPEAVKERDAHWQKAGYLPVDVAGLATKDGNRYAVVWVKGQAGERAGLDVEAATNAEHKAGSEAYQKDGFEPATLSSWKDQAGVLRYASVWFKGPGLPRKGTPSWLNEEDAHVGQVLDGAQVPLDVAVSAESAAALTEARHPVQGIGVMLLQRQPLGLASATLSVPLPGPPRARYAAVWNTDSTREAQGLSGLSAEAHLTRCRELAAQGYRPAGLSLTVLDGQARAASVWHRPLAKREDRELLARRQATGAATLLKMNAAQAVWPLFRFRPDPEVRSQLIWRSGLLGVSAEQVVARLEQEKDVTARRALILTLGEYTDKELPLHLRQRLLPLLLGWYRDDPDAGLHGAVDWLLRHGMEGPDKRLLDWQQAAALKTIDGELASGGRQPPDARRWYVNGQGQTMIVIPGPVTFRMGAPLADPERNASERPHLRRIPRRYALASKSVTVEEFQRFLKERPDVEGEFTNRYSPAGTGPTIGVSWYVAAQYCNWLSDKEGLPEKEWCYPRHEDIKDGMKLDAQYLKRQGYRLPTEAEWEYAARAETASSRSYGSSEELLPRFAWYLSNVRDQAWPVGQKRPNEMGLFDIQGNVWNWVADGYFRYPQSRGKGGVDDVEGLYGLLNLDITDSKMSRVLRGGAFFGQPALVRATNRYYYRPAFRLNTVGLRPARTLLP